ncbi:MAG: BamA/TamA family outer membrane protein [Hyphomicrobiales bacterium]|nr:BamA/TamA family outer membrane protein [Hyphomicrobiales bacterium]
MQLHRAKLCKGLGARLRAISTCGGLACQSPLRPFVGILAALVAASALCPVAAKAFDFSFLDPFGLFSSKEEPPKPNASSLPYIVSFNVTGGDPGDASDVEQALKDASNLYRLRNDAPPDGDVLARRAATDLNPLLDALWAKGYYNAIVRVRVGDGVLNVAQEPTPALIRAAEAWRNRALVPVQVDAELGALFRLRNVTLSQAAQALPVPERIIGLKPEDPARAADVRAAQARVIDFYRAQSYPLANSRKLAATVNHEKGIMDVVIGAEPGPRAGFGEVTVTGTTNVPEEVVRSYIYIDPGEPYSPEKIAVIRRSVAAIPAIGGVRIREATTLDAQGNLPIVVDVSERPNELFGVNLRFSSVGGPNIHPYFEIRNVFGGAERLRLDADGFLAPNIDGGPSGVEPRDFAGRIALSFLKPALGGSRFDFLFDALAERQRIGTIRFGGYTVRDASATASLRYRFSEFLSVQAGVTGGWAQSSDVLGEATATLIGLPGSVKYDTTDNLLDPTRGVRISAQVTPYPTFLGSTVGFVDARAQASAYYALDENANYVLAGRIAGGALIGGPLQDIPSNYRFYAGGGGSVRGFRYRTLSPMLNGKLTGGRTLLEGSLEARVKITQTIELVPFIDAGGAYATNLPNLTERTGIGAGLGLRYLTAIGPIRLDLATPVNPRKGDKPVVLYLSIGQAF